MLPNGLDGIDAQVVCPVCATGIETTHYLEVEEVWDCNSVNLSDWSDTCPTCGYKLEVEIEEVQVLVRKVSVKVPKVSKPRYHLGQRFFSRKEGCVYTLDNYEPYLNLGYVYTFKADEEGHPDLLGYGFFDEELNEKNALRGDLIGI